MHENVYLNKPIFEGAERPLVYTQNNAPCPNIGASSAINGGGITLERMREILNKPQSFYVNNGKVTLIDENTGEVRTEEKKNPRAERWVLKSAVNRLLPRSRTSRCHKWVLPNAKPTIYRHIKEGESKAFYGGLEVCGSVWACPICAAKIAERRRNELSQAIAQAKIQGLSVSMLTLTAPHYISDDLPDLLNRMMSAYTKLWKDKAGKNLISKYAIVGRIRAFEVTYGDNGFHPHFHVLLFTENPIANKAEMEFSFFPVWLNCCLKKGLGAPNLKHGVRVDLANDEIGRYVAKWGLDNEMTKGHIKRSSHGFSMFDLLRSYVAGNDEHGSLWVVYAKAFKGKRQLVWTNGLKERLLIEDKTDEELAIEEQEGASPLAELSLDEWRAVYRTGSEHYVLKVAENSPGTIKDLISSLMKLEDGIKRATGGGGAEQRQRYASTPHAARDRRTKT